MKGILFVNGYYFSESDKRRCERLIGAFSARGVKTTVYRNNVPLRKESFVGVDFCVFFDKDYFASRFIENLGVRVFNRTEVLEITDNKNKTYAFLYGKTGVEMPATVLAPKKFFDTQDREYLDAVGSLLGFPLVLKEACGSLGKQVYLIENKEELYLKDAETGTKDKQFQSFRKESYGKSIRVLCIGKKAIGGMRLSSSGDFRSNAHLGGAGEKISLNEAYRDAAEEIARILDADYLGIDFFADRPILIEVNGNAYFDKFEQTTGVDVAKAYVDYILESFSR